MKHNFIRVILISVCLIFSIVHAYQSSSPENASVEIVGIEDGEVYKSPINIEFVIIEFVLIILHAILTFNFIRLCLLLLHFFFRI